MQDVETIHVRGEGGSVFAMDLPLPDGIRQRFERGLIQRVNADDSPFTGAPAPARTVALASASAREEPAAAPVDRPSVNQPKADWIAYVVKSGRLSAEDAANYTKADLIELAG